MDPLIQSLVRVESLDEKARKAVSEMALHFVLAGGRVTLSEWMAMDPETKAAFIDAAKAREERKAEILAGAILAAWKVHFQGVET